MQSCGPDRSCCGKALGEFLHQIITFQPSLFTPAQVKQALIAELRAGPDLLPAEQRVVADSIVALEGEAEDLLVLAGEHYILKGNENEPRHMHYGVASPHLSKQRGWFFWSMHVHALKGASRDPYVAAQRVS